MIADSGERPISYKISSKLPSHCRVTRRRGRRRLSSICEGWGRLVADEALPATFGINRARNGHAPSCPGVVAHAFTRTNLPRAPSSSQSVSIGSFETGFTVDSVDALRR
jgi:hypothetical protein